LAAAIALKRSADTASADGAAGAHVVAQIDANLDRQAGSTTTATASASAHTNGSAAQPAASSAAPGEASDEAWLRPLHEALLGFDAASLRKHAGKAGYRWAWQFVQDLDPERGLRIDGERHIRIAFAHPRIGFRYMGGGLDALIGDTALSPIEKYRVAAVLGYRRAHGAAIEPPEATGDATAQALDFGKDHALGERGAQAREDARARLRLRAKQLLLECVELGLSHLSPSIAQRFATLAVWAQGTDDYRLALLLRRLADHVEWLNERAGGADEHRLCDEIALVYGLLAALDAAAVRGAAPAHLLGRARNRYQSGGRLELLGLGAHAWRSASGYVGLTMLFFSPQDQAFFSCTDARPEQQRGFDPVARYRAAGPWSGLGAPQQATGQCVVLEGAQLSANGRLSASEHTHASVHALDADAFLAQLPAQTRWDALLQARAEAKRSLLAEAQPMRDWTVLQPQRFGEARFDAARQTLVWPVYDADDARLDLELVYSAQTEHAIGRVEAVAAAGLRAGTRVVARMRSEDEAVAEPLSLVYADARGRACAVDALHFDSFCEPAPAQAGSALTRGLGHTWKQWRGRHAAAPPPAMAAGASLLPAPLRELRHALLAHAERGIGPAAAAGAAQALAARLRRLRDAGFHAFPPALADATPLPEHLLRLHYLQLQYARLCGDRGDEQSDGSHLG
jgi:hypothetical protein